MISRSDKWYQKNAWILLSGLSLPFLIFGISALLFGVGLSNFPVGIPGGPDAVESLTGMTWTETLAGNPAAVTLFRGVSRVAGLALVGFATFVLVVSVVSYRQRQRWAWFALWTVPAFMVGLTLHELRGSFVQMPAVILVLSLLALVLPFRRFFPSAR